MTKIKRLLISAVVAGVLLVAIGMLFVAECRPPMPSEWGRIRSGMPRQEVLAVLVEGVVDMRDLKGFDVITARDVPFLGSPSYWQLLITYDGASRVATAKAQFHHRSCGLLSTKPRSIL